MVSTPRPQCGVALLAITRFATPTLARATRIKLATGRDCVHGATQMGAITSTRRPRPLNAYTTSPPVGPATTDAPRCRNAQTVRMDSSQARAAHRRRPALCSAILGIRWSVACAPAYRRHVCQASHHVSRVLLERILPHLAPIHRRAAVSAMAGRTHPRLAANPAASAEAALIPQGLA